MSLYLSSLLLLLLLSLLLGGLPSASTSLSDLSNLEPLSLSLLLLLLSIDIGESRPWSSLAFSIFFCWCGLLF
jgi:hypothetical protein